MEQMTNKTPQTVHLTPEEEDRMIMEEYNALITAYMNSKHRRKVERIEKAFLLARKAHDGVKRKSGIPYITHPLAVARIVCEEMGLGSTSIVCALLHDVIEDTDYTAEDLRTMFGDKVAQIVEGLTKIPSDMFQQGENVSAQAENFRKLLLTMNEDIRVILIKIADRLHNMRTLDAMPIAKQMKIAGETLYIYAPIAHRLGLFSIKTELEELSFAIEHPREYADITNQIAASEEERNEIFEHFAQPLKERFAAMNLTYEMKTRVKSAYSIWHKMQEKKIPFEEVYDLYAVRIIFESRPDINDKDLCWDIYGRITDIYRTKPERIRDWVTNPKSNGYRALHTTVMGPNGQWIEVQIRSRKMDDIAELGFAAHWKYKSEVFEEDSELEKWLATIREILESPTPDSMDFLDTFKLNLYTEEISVFTPKGKMISLPQKATALDFAFAIHGEIGKHCIGAKVNHRLVPFNYTLQNGDQVEIITSEKQLPSHEWLHYVTSAKARAMIDEVLRKRRREAISSGEKEVIALFQKDGQTVTTTHLDKVANYFNFRKREEFFYAVGNKSIALPDSFKKLIQEGDKGNFFTRMFRYSKGNKASIPSSEKEASSSKINPKKPFLLEEFNFTPNYAIALCCSPILGDETIGFIEKDEQVVIHKRSCPNAMRLKSSAGNSIVQTLWGDHPNSLFETTFEINGIDSIGILNAIIQYISEDINISITSINLSSHSGVFGGTFKVMVRNTDDVRRVCEGLKKNPSINSISRV